MPLIEEKEHPLLLIAEDDEMLGKTLKLEFQERNYEVLWVQSLKDFNQQNLKNLEFALVDLRLAGESGLDLIQKLKESHPKTRMIVLTGYGSIPTAVEAMKRGASHYLTKPAQIDDIERTLWGEESSADVYQQPAETLAQHERDFIESILLQSEGNISLAAKRLGIHRQSLQRKLRKFC